MKLADNLNDHLPVTYSDFILLCPTPTIDAEPSLLLGSTPTFDVEPPKERPEETCSSGLSHQIDLGLRYIHFNGLIILVLVTFAVSNGQFLCDLQFACCNSPVYSNYHVLGTTACNTQNGVILHLIGELGQ